MSDFFSQTEDRLLAMLAPLLTANGGPLRELHSLHGDMSLVDRIYEATRPCGLLIPKPFSLNDSTYEMTQPFTLWLIDDTCIGEARAFDGVGANAGLNAIAHDAVALLQGGGQAGQTLTIEVTGGGPLFDPDSGRAAMTVEIATEYMHARFETQLTTRTSLRAEET